MNETALPIKPFDGSKTTMVSFGEIMRKAYTIKNAAIMTAAAKKKNFLGSRSRNKNSSPVGIKIQNKG